MGMRCAASLLRDRVVEANALFALRHLEAAMTSSLSPSSRIVVLTLAMVLALACPADAKKKPRPTPCPAARFLIEGAPLIGDPVPLTDALAWGGNTVAIESGCEPADTVRVQAKKKLTLVTAIWKKGSCDAVPGKMTLSAKIDAATCSTISGKLLAPKAKIKRKFSGQLAGVPTLDTGPFTPAPLTRTVVGSDGGTVAVEDPASPLAGIEIVVPPGATDEPITFEIAWADVTGTAGLPTGARRASKLIRIRAEGSAAWNQYRAFSLPVRVTLPYEEPGDGEETVRFYVQNADGSLEPAGFEAIDQGGNTITFYTSVFADTAEASVLGDAAAPALATSDISAGRPAGIDRGRPASVVSSAVFNGYVAVGLSQQTLAALLGGRSVDTGFRSSVHGWFIPNYGSYYKFSRGGSCFGFVGAAKYYYRRGFSPTLYASYRDPDRTATWVDDAVAIEFTSRVHNGMADIWDQFVSGEVNIQQPSSRQVALSWVGAMYVTGAPALLYIQQALPQPGGGVAYAGAHAISVYRVDITPTGRFTFHVYDPNFPGDDGRRIIYTTSTGFVSYPSGTTAGASAFIYNFFKHVGFHVGLSNTVLDRIKQAADRAFRGDTVFPQVMIETVRGGRTGTDATEAVTAQGDHKYVIDDNSVRIQGTILGGLAQDACCVVNDAQVFLSNRRYSTPVNNMAGGGDGRFDVTVPISQGESELVILGAQANTFSHWAAFKRDVIESTFSPAAMEITLSWNQNASDVDLYVQEPDGTGTTGDTVYFGHRNGVSTTHPYLDFDNTRGFGPEHYIAVQGMTTLYTDGATAPNLYGTYRVKAHYFRDHDDDPDTTQPITWQIRYRYLAFCADPCTDPEATGVWREGSFNGSLGSDSPGNCCSIGNSGGDWSPLSSIAYPVPNPDDYRIPDPPGVMLP
jgi:uncharacterized protein YfaP (DUF2135 family)